MELFSVHCIKVSAMKLVRHKEVPLKFPIRLSFLFRLVSSSTEFLISNLNYI